jgi:hypothetical protein
MDSAARDFIASGRRLIYDTKAPKPSSVGVSKVVKEQALGNEEKNPHKRFVKYCIDTKPKIPEMIKEFEKFIEAEEAKL